MPYKDIEKQREYQRLWMARRRSAWFEENGPCVDCGSWEDLELDHVDRLNKISHYIWSWSKSRRELELAKCVARCKLCHSIKSLHEQPARVLTESLVLEIRERRSRGETIMFIASVFGVSFSTVQRVTSFNSWKNVV